MNREPSALIPLLKSFFDASPQALCVAHQQTVIYANGPCSELLDGNVAGLPLSDILRTANEWKRAGTPMRLLNGKGVEIALEVATWPIRLEDSEFTAICLRPLVPKTDEHELLERLYREASAGLAFIDENLRYRKINRQLADLNGLSVEAHLGKRVVDVLPHLAPYLEPILRGVLDSGVPVVNLELAGSDWKHEGREVHSLVNFHPFEQGGVRGVQGCVVDITTLEQTKNELLRQTKIFEQVHDSVIQTDLEGRIVAWNDGARQLFGYTFDEVAGRHVSMLYFEEDREQAVSRVFEPLLANGRHELTVRNRRSDGAECWIRLSLSLLRDRAGKSYGMVGYSEDITARLRAETALKSSEQRYRQLFESNPVGVAIWRPDGILIDANPCFMNLLGWSAEQFRAGEIGPWGHGAAGPGACELILTALQAGHTGTFEGECARSDGTTCPVLIGVPEREGAASDVLMYLVDLTQQKAAERVARESREYLELALTGAELGVWDWNIASGHVTFNERWARMLGYEPSEIEPDVSAWERLVHPVDREQTLAALDAHLNGTSPAYQSEHRLLSKSGEWRWVLDCGKVIERAADGRPLRAAGTHLDISARKEAELALGRSEQRFRAAFNQTFQFMSLLTPEGIVLEVNETVLKFAGVRRETVVDRPLWEAYPWSISRETTERLGEAVRRAAAGEFVRYEVDLWGEGQVVTPVDFSVRPMFDDAGHVTVLIAEGRDLTDLKRAQKLELAEKERRRLEAVLRFMTKGVVIAEPNGDVVSANPAALRLLGFEKEENARRALRHFSEFELRTLDGRLIGNDEWPLARAAHGQTFTGYELEVTRTDTGKRFIGSFGAAPVLDDDGKVVLLVQTVRDVTHQYEVERQLRRSNQERDFALQASGMRAWRWHFTPGNLRNTAVPAEILGQEDADKRVVEASWTSIHPEDRQKLLAFGRGLAPGEPVKAEYRVLSQEGEHEWRAARGRPIVSEQGEVFGLAGVTWDITQQKQAEAEIERMNTSLHELSGELLRSLDQERRKLARELHDGPVQMLSAASMNLSILARSNAFAGERDKRLAEECTAWVRQCSESMRSMSYLLHPPVLDELGLSSALRGWILGFADRTGLDVELDLQELGRMDPETEVALFRIAQEALANIHRHSRSSAARVRLKRGEAVVQLEVEDDGCGIPSGVLEGRHVGRALGVGIRGMRERARQFGGTLEVSSNPGRTVVKASLPEQNLT